MNSTTAVAVGENVLSIYKIKEYPSLQKEIEIDNEIERVFFDSKHIGIVVSDSESGNLYKLTVYDTNAKKVCETTFNTEYDDMRFDGKSVIMSSSTEFSLVNLKGKVLTKLDVDLPIEDILPTNNRGRYIMVNSKYVQDIRLN
jgi:hypothetical protein